MEEQIINKYRQEFLNNLNQLVYAYELEMVKVIKKMEKSESGMIVKAEMASIVEEMLSLNALIAALKYGGKAKSLVFITSNGQALDLLNIRELNENQIINEMLDNYQLNKQ